MKVSQALRVLNEARGRASSKTYYLACGFTPLHLQTFLAALLQETDADRRVIVEAPGSYGDLIGNLARIPLASQATVFMEWSDLDVRLGFRGLAEWSSATTEDILQSVDGTLRRLYDAVQCRAGVGLTVINLPVLPIVPIEHLPQIQAGNLGLFLRAKVLDFAAQIALLKSVRVANPEWQVLPAMRERLDLQSELKNGFPYALDTAAAIAREAVVLLQLPPARKGLITDLDNTCWRGILGDDGLDGIAWTQEAHAQEHGLYQQVLKSLGQAGVLVAIASKNERTAVDEALALPDMILKPADVFPIEAHWGRKSDSVANILRTWNIGADDVVFVDDNPMELEEVRTAFPGMECLPFPTGNVKAVYELLLGLRNRFGKAQINEEDRLRSQSLRRTALTQSEAGRADPAFVASLKASIGLSLGARFEADRAFELVNKTNQFNINGLRYTIDQWVQMGAEPGRFLGVIEYTDKFGPLGRISVVSGRISDREARIDVWVLSCRAFSRQIEHASLQALFQRYELDAIHFDYSRTAKNSPVAEFFAEFGELPQEKAVLRLDRETFNARCLSLGAEISFLN